MEIHWQWKIKNMRNKFSDENIYPFPNFHAWTIEIWEWILNFILHFIMDLIANPFWDLS